MVLVKQIEALLPQTQCGECHYSGCLPYAEALAQGKAKINQCPPGGVATLTALGALLNIDATPFLNEAEANTRAPSVAVIREAECIGCTKCIKACPVDAIIGSGKLMHAVITHECTGCGLCVAPCPVDCIEMVALPSPQYDKELARHHFNAKKTRLLREKMDQYHNYKAHAHSLKSDQDKQTKQEYIRQALARAQKKKNE